MVLPDRLVEQAWMEKYVNEPQAPRSVSGAQLQGLLANPDLQNQIRQETQVYLLVYDHINKALFVTGLYIAREARIPFFIDPNQQFPDGTYAYAKWVPDPYKKQFENQKLQLIFHTPEADYELTFPNNRPIKDTLPQLVPYSPTQYSHLPLAE